MKSNSMTRLGRWWSHLMWGLLGWAICTAAGAVDINRYTTVEYTQDGKTERCVFFDGFVDNKNGTVTDPRNGTVWMQCPLGSQWDGHVCKGEAKQFTWFDAMTAAKQQNFAGHKDWRLPGVEEFDSATVNRKSCYDIRDSAKRFPASTLLLPPHEPIEEYPRSWTSKNYIQTEDDKTFRTRSSKAYFFSLASGYDSDWSISFSDKRTEPVRLARAGPSEHAEAFEKQFALLDALRAQVKTNDGLNADLANSNARNEMKKCEEKNFEGDDCRSLKRGQTWLFKLSNSHPEVQTALAYAIMVVLLVGAPWILIRRQLLVHRWLPSKWWARALQLMALFMVCWLVGGVAAFNSNSPDGNNFMSYTDGYSDALGESVVQIVIWSVLAGTPYLAVVYLVRWIFRKFTRNKSTQQKAEVIQ